MSNSNIESFQAFLLEQYQEYTREQIIVKQSILSKYQDYFDGVSKNIFIIKHKNNRLDVFDILFSVPDHYIIHENGESFYVTVNSTSRIPNTYMSMKAFCSVINDGCLNVSGCNFFSDIEKHFITNIEYYIHKFEVM